MTRADAIRGARALTPGGWTGPVEVVVGAAGTIAELRPATGPVPEVSLVPGFVDLQVNGHDDVDVATADGADWDRLDGLLLAQGITTWCPTLVTMPLARFAAPLERIGAAMRRPATGRPTIAGAHLEGPFLGGAPGAHRRDWVIDVDMPFLAGLPEWARGAASGSRTPTISSSTASNPGITATQNTARKSLAHSSISAVASKGPTNAPTVSSDWRRPKAAPRTAGGVMSATSASRGAPRMPLPTRSMKRAATTTPAPLARANTGLVTAPRA